jgi:multiple sugar transport system ATP-binding protein
MLYLHPLTRSPVQEKSMGVLAVRDLTRRLGGNPVVDGVSFQIEEGEFFVLLGASGSGKSTLLRLICGLEQPDQGAVVVDGREVTRLPARERNLGMVFQDYGLYPNMNVYQNIAYGLETRGVARQVIQERVPQAAAMLGLGDMLQRAITDLSGGEQQRVALARALVKDASAYLFDEPLSNLDPKLRHQARRDILAIHRTKRKPSLYVTHDQSEAFAMADRIALMAQGRLLQIGSAEQLLHEPANMYVAGFIGSPPMNLLPADLQHQAGHYHAATPDLRVALPERWSPVLERYGKAHVVLGIRPDALEPEHRRDLPSDGRSQVLVAEVEDIEGLVGETVVALKLGPSTRLTALFQDDGMTALHLGEALRVRVDVDRISLFDPDSQQAL